jgi:hypothetical protein
MESEPRKRGEDGRGRKKISNSLIEMIEYLLGENAGRGVWKH